MEFCIARIPHTTHHSPILPLKIAIKTFVIKFYFPKIGRSAIKVNFQGDIMSSRNKPQIVKGNKTEVNAHEDIDWDDQPPRSKPEQFEKVESKFEPRLRKTGELILANDWNDIQVELKDDVERLSASLNFIASHSSILMASGVASHGVYIELKWSTKPIVIVAYSGPVNGLEDDESNNFRCFPYETSNLGFKIFARSEDGRTDGIVNWIAVGAK